MEKQKFGVESGSSKVLKLLALVLGMGAAEQAMAQVPMEQLVKEAKVIEMQLSENAAKKGKQLLVNGVPAVAIDNDSSKLQVRYLDNERTKPISFLIYKNKKYFWDSDADGKIDGIYVDKNENEGKMPSEEEYMKVKLTIMSGGPSQTELDLGDMMNKGKGNKYIYFSLQDNKVYDSTNKSITDIEGPDSGEIGSKMQKRFVGELKGWSVF